MDMTRSRSGHSDQIPRRGVHFGPESPPVREEDEQPLDQIDSGLSGSRDRRKSAEQKRKLEKRPTDRLEDRPAADAYFDSRAATKREFKRRASTLQDYYKQHPPLLPQLPFTWKHGWRRWKLFALIFLMFVDACVIPIVLYYTMKFVGNVQGFISAYSPICHSICTYPCQFSPLLPPSGAVLRTSSSQSDHGVLSRKKTSTGPSARIVVGHLTLSIGLRPSASLPSLLSSSLEARPI